SGLHQLQLVQAHLGGEQAVIDHGIALFDGVNAAHGLSLRKAYPVPDLQYGSGPVLFLLDLLFFLGLFFDTDLLDLVFQFLGQLGLLLLFFLDLGGGGLLSLAVLGFHQAQQFRDQGSFFVVQKIAFGRRVHLVAQLDHPLVVVIEFLIVLQFGLDLVVEPLQTVGLFARLGFLLLQTGSGLNHFTAFLLQFGDGGIEANLAVLNFLFGPVDQGIGDSVLLGHFEGKGTSGLSENQLEGGLQGLGIEQHVCVGGM